MLEISIIMIVLTIKIYYQNQSFVQTQKGLWEIFVRKPVFQIFKSIIFNKLKILNFYYSFIKNCCTWSNENINFSEKLKIFIKCCA